jgi:hypothetical protein
MFFDNPMLFDRAAQELLRPLAHKITITPYGGQAGIYRLVRRVRNAKTCSLLADSRWRIRVAGLGL